MQTGTKTSEKQSITPPDPPQLLMAGLSETSRQLADAQQALKDKDHIIVEQQKLLKLLEEKLRLAKVQRYGSSSEKLSLQKGLFDEAELEVALDELEQQLPAEDTTPRKRAKKRDGFSDKLPRVRIELTLSDAQKAGAGQTFFTKVKEELDIIPAKARVLEY